MYQVMKKLRSLLLVIKQPKKKTITDLNNDVFQMIFNELPLKSRSQFSQTCKQINHSFRCSPHWYSLFKENHWEVIFKHSWLKNDEINGLLKLIETFRPDEKYPVYFLIKLLNKFNHESLPWFNSADVTTPYYRAKPSGCYARWFKNGIGHFYDDNYYYGCYKEIPIPKLEHLAAMWKIIKSDYRNNNSGGSDASFSIQNNYQTKIYAGRHTAYLTKEGEFILKLLCEYTEKCVTLYALYEHIIGNNTFQVKQKWTDISDNDDFLYEIIQTSADLSQKKVELEDKLFGDKKESKMTRHVVKW